MDDNTVFFRSRTAKEFETGSTEATGEKTSQNSKDCKVRVTWNKHENRAVEVEREVYTISEVKREVYTISEVKREGYTISEVKRERYTISN